MFINLKIKGAYGIFGTGIWPYEIGKAPISSHMSVEIGDKIIGWLFRDYISILYLPLIPMKLSAGLLADDYKPSIDIGFIRLDQDRVRLPLNKENKDRLVDYVSTHTTMRAERKAARILRGSWWLSFLIAAAGGVLGGIFFNGLILQILGGVLGCGLINRIYIKYLNIEKERSW